MSKPLTQTRIDALKPRRRPFKVFDGGGLHLLVTPSGGKLWRLSYRVFETNPKKGEPRVVPKVLALGSYDREANSLTHARAAREAAKLALKDGRDPARAAPALDGQASFETVARAWHAHNKSGWAPKYASLILARLEQDVFPQIGAKPIGAVRRSDIRTTLEKVQERGAIETAHRLKQYIGGVFRFSDDDTVSDPTPMLKGRLKPRPAVEHFKKLRANEIGPFLNVLDASTCEPLTRWAMLLTILTAARTMEVIGARWDEFEDLKYSGAALWRIPKERMKKGREHLVPLSLQAQSIVKALHERAEGSEYLFPGANGRNGHMSNNTMIFHCYAMGYRNKTTMHGFRGSFSTIANESGLWAPDVIEVALAHADGDAVRAAYNSALHLPKRRELLQWWADEVDAMRSRVQQDARFFS